MADVVDRARREVVERVDAMATVEELVGEMGSDEAGSAGDQYAHLRIVL
jgi:hypothetical protein